METEWKRNGFTVSTDPARINVTAVHEYLTNSYWANGITRDAVVRSIAYSMPFGMYTDDEQLGFARVITDRTTFAYLSDVFIFPDAQGKGLGKWFMEVIISHPELQGLRRWLLFTRDARGLYEKFGFGDVGDRSVFMERR